VDCALDVVADKHKLLQYFGNVPLEITRYFSHVEDGLATYIESRKATMIKELAGEEKELAEEYREVRIRALAIIRGKNDISLSKNLWSPADLQWTCLKTRDDLSTVHSLSP
jgi:hypothetical protein